MSDGFFGILFVWVGLSIWVSGFFIGFAFGRRVTGNGYQPSDTGKPQGPPSRGGTAVVTPK
jgi:hypothetical protein